VNWILSVGSDLRYEIYAKFAEAGIEIPFAQRDVHIKNISELKGGPGTAPASE
jgi:small-conductance mechanosensitive channel